MNQHGNLDTDRCAAIVTQPPHYLHFYQCNRKPGHGRDGAYCKQHAKQRRYQELKEG